MVAMCLCADNGLCVGISSDSRENIPAEMERRVTGAASAKLKHRSLALWITDSIDVTDQAVVQKPVARTGFSGSARSFGGSETGKALVEAGNPSFRLCFSDLPGVDGM